MSYSDGLCRIIPAVPPIQVSVKNHRKNRSNTIATNFQSCTICGWGGSLFSRLGWSVGRSVGSVAGDKGQRGKNLIGLVHNDNTDNRNPTMAMQMPPERWRCDKGNFGKFNLKLRAHLLDGMANQKLLARALKQRRNLLGEDIIWFNV